MRTGGLILLDNTLRGGQVADPVARSQPVNKALDALNRKLATDSRLQVVLLPMADGMTLCRKLPGPGLETRRSFDPVRRDNVRLK